MSSLVLYKKDTCPFCLKVTDFARRRGIQLETRDVAKDPEALRELVEVGGKRQVPCLFVDGAPLYESDDIISYLARSGS